MNPLSRCADLSTNDLRGNSVYFSSGPFLDDPTNCICECLKVARLPNVFGCAQREGKFAISLSPGNGEDHHRNVLGVISFEHSKPSDPWEIEIENDKV